MVTSPFTLFCVCTVSGCGSESGSFVVASSDVVRALPMGLLRPITYEIDVFSRTGQILCSSSHFLLGPEAAVILAGRPQKFAKILAGYRITSYLAGGGAGGMCKRCSLCTGEEIQAVDDHPVPRPLKSAHPCHSRPTLQRTYWPSATHSFSERRTFPKGCL